MKKRTNLIWRIASCELQENELNNSHKIDTTIILSILCYIISCIKPATRNSQLVTMLLLLVGSSSSWAQNALSPDIQVTLENERKINSTALEYSPAFYENGIIYISDTKKDGGGLLDTKINKHAMSIFRAKRDEDGKLEEPEIFAEEITTKFHEGPLTFNKVNDRIFFTRDNYEDGKAVKSSEGRIKLQIFSATLSGGKWANVEKLSFNNKEHEFAHPSINVDDNVLYFASDRPGGHGGMDLWKVEKSGSSWGEPINLGAGVNTSGHEIFPYIHADGTLFFSSYGHNSMGGLDIFFSKETEGNFNNPVSLGPRFNSTGDDLGFIIDRDKKNGYFSSNREGGNGQDDIYSFFIDVPLGEDIFQDPDPDGADGEELAATGPYANTNGSELKGFGKNRVMVFVADRTTGAELDGAKIDYVDLEALTNTEIITDQNGNIIQLISTENGEVVTLSTESGTVGGFSDAEGAFVLKLGDGNYLVNIAREGYQPKQVIVSMADGRDEYMVLLDRATNCTSIKGYVVYDSGEAVPGAAVRITKDDGTSVETVTANENGVFDVCIPCGQRFAINGSKNGVAATTYITTDPNCNGGSPMSVTVSLPGSAAGGPLAGGGPINPGTVIRLAKIYYNFNDASIRPDAVDELDALAAILNKYQNIQIELASHTDSRGTTDYNNQLSQRRADKVVAYMVEQGIDPSRLNPVGYGESQLLNQCTDGVTCSETEHQYNRRTEVRVLGAEVEVEYVNNPPETIDRAPSYVSNSGGEEYTGSSSSSSDGSSSSSDGGISYAGGTYYVIAGTFSVKDNAINRLARIHTLGFDQAYIMTGVSSATNAVCVGSFNNYNEARALADKVENIHNIHTYVRRGG